MSQPHLSPLKKYGTGPPGSYLQAWTRRWQVGEANTYLSELNPLLLSAVHCLLYHCFHRDLGGWPYSWRSRQRTHEGKSSGFPLSFVTNLPTLLSSGPIFPLSFYLLTYIQYVSSFLLLLLSLANLGSSWALAFLSASLCAWVVFQYSPSETCSLFHLSHVPFLHLSSLSSSLFNQAGFLLCQLLFLLRWMDCPCALRRLSLKVSQYSWTPLASKAGSSGIPPTISLSKLKAALVKFWGFILLLTFFTPLRMLNSTILSLQPRLPLSVFKRSEEDFICFSLPIRSPIQDTHHKHSLDGDTSDFDPKALSWPVLLPASPDHSFTNSITPPLLLPFLSFLTSL